MISSRTTSAYSSFFFNDSATTNIYTLSLHDALPIFTCIELQAWDGTVSEQEAATAGTRMASASLVARLHRQPRPSLERSEEHTSELQSQSNLVCRLLLEYKKSRSSRQLWAD